MLLLIKCVNYKKVFMNFPLRKYLKQEDVMYIFFLFSTYCIIIVFLCYVLDGELSFMVV